MLGAEHSQRGGARWSSNASALSGYSQSSNDTSSTATTTAIANEDVHLTRLKVLIVRASMNVGFQRSAGQTLSTFVKSLPPNSFGMLSWHMNLLEHYKQMILTDPAFRAPVSFPSRRASAADVARSVQWMVRGGAVYLSARPFFGWCLAFELTKPTAEATFSSRHDLFCHDGFWTRLKEKMKWNELERGLQLALELSRLAFSSRKTLARGPRSAELEGRQERKDI